ncbi:phosphatidate cytidylyltransferase [Erysipelothrix sp. HDW6A]|uniref:phosphatidate cytidylyltransferase n=1 Tax=Erysipelothrix sp. HDW6A TaxID=2714928 RepID=UPI001408A56D|nr:phosphatidate cytidylyltransferase [Erysipelothrix sp. HDW6A]QIK57583.1 phosphatidate cytidylyltransferase [Erysipelothrix sp. HDW6A]
MKDRIVTALILIAVFGSAFLMNNQALFLLIEALILVGAYEIYQVKKDQLKPIIFGIILAFTIIGSSLSIGDIPGYIMVLIMTLFILTVVFEWFSFDDVSYIFTMIMMLTTAMIAVNKVLEYDRLVFFYILLATYLTDTAAFFGGYFFGKHKLIPRISPKKTVEGAVIGFAASAIGSFSFAYFFLQAYIPIKIMIACSIAIPILGQFGDLAFSLIKRHFKIKDFGSLFPGHGGVLDRVDSAIFALYTFYIVLMLLG